MGQYYHVLMKCGHKEYPNDLMLSDGKHVMLKLMEHSWWENPFVGTITGLIHDYDPMRIWWIGDYADSFYDSEWNVIPEEALTKEQRTQRKLYAKVWKDSDSWKPFRPDENVVLLDGKYLVNLTKKEYIDCDAYKKASEVEYEYRTNGGVEQWTDVIHPLPILTCVGNGLGGGDYGGACMNFVGSWAGDYISVEDAEPEGMRRIAPFFKEKED